MVSSSQRSLHVFQSPLTGLLSANTMHTWHDWSRPPLLLSKYRHQVNFRNGRTRLYRPWSIRFGGPYNTWIRCRVCVPCRGVGKKYDWLCRGPTNLMLLSLKGVEGWCGDAKRHWLVSYLLLWDKRYQPNSQSKGQEKKSMIPSVFCFSIKDSSIICTIITCLLFQKLVIQHHL